MKTPLFSVLAILMISTATTVPAQDPVLRVESASAPRETRRTLGIAPSSGVNREVAAAAARRLAPLVAGTKVCVVQATGSMRPLFDENSLLLMEPAPFSSLQIGDIVVFQRTGTEVMIVHRILERRRNGFWTKGDHNNGMDTELVTEANYQGRVYGILYTTRSNNSPAPGALASKAIVVTAGKTEQAPAAADR